MEFQLINAVRSGDVEAVKEVLNEALALLSPPTLDEGAEQPPVESSVEGVLIEDTPVSNPFVFMGGATPLHWACQEGQPEIAKLFIEKKLNPINTVDGTGASALHWAADEGHLECIKLLVENGVNVNIVDHEGEHCLIRAAYMGHSDALDYLIKAGADVNIKNDSGTTALHAAVLNGHADAVVTLVGNNADLTITNKDGKTAIQLAETMRPDFKPYFDKEGIALRGEIKKLKGAVDDLDKKAKEAESKKDETQRKLMSVFAQLKEAEDNVKEEKDKNAELLAKLEEAEKEKQALIEKIQAMEKAEEERREEAEAMKNKLDQRAGDDSGKIKELENELLSVKDQLAASDAVMASLDEKLKAAVMEAQVETKMRHQWQEKSRELRLELVKAKASGGGLSAANEAVERRLNYLKNAFMSLREVFDVTVQAIGNTTEQLEGLDRVLAMPKEGEIDQLDNILDELNARNVAKQEEREKVAKEKEEIEKQKREQEPVASGKLIIETVEERVYS